MGTSQSRGPAVPEARGESAGPQAQAALADPTSDMSPEAVADLQDVLGNQALLDMVGGEEEPAQGAGAQSPPLGQFRGLGGDGEAQEDAAEEQPVGNTLDTPTGIAAETAVKSFAGEAKAALAKTGTADERRAALIAAANKQLAAVKVPPIQSAWWGRQDAARFLPASWTMQLPKTWFEGQQADVSVIADTVYHEARHAEQFFRLARLRAQKGEKPAAIARALRMRLAEVTKATELAAKEPIGQDSQEAAEAASWRKGLFLSGRKNRRRKQLERKIARARSKWNKHRNSSPMEAAMAKVELFKLEKEYFKLCPHEKDAYGAGRAVTAELGK